MPYIFRNMFGGIIYLSILFLSASIGSVLIMAPLMPLMVLYPVFYRKVMDHLMGLWLILPVGLIELMFDVKLYITGDRLKMNESCLVMMNHRTTIDWLFFWEVFWQQSCVKREKIILKKSLKVVPGFGWAMQVAMYIFLARKWETDQPWIKMMLDYFGKLKYKAQILIFPEGTDFNPKSLSRSESYAKKYGLQCYEYVLHPRTTGFVYVTQTMRQNGIIDAIYDVTVGYPCQIPECGELDSLYGNFPDEVHFHIKRHPISTIPTSDEDVEKWCVDKWREKESLLEKFYTQDKCFHDDQQNGSTNNVKAKHCCISKGVLWPVMAFWLLFAVFAPTLLWYSSVARYQVVIFGVLMQMINLVGGTEMLACSALNWRYRNKILTHGKVHLRIKDSQK